MTESWTLLRLNPQHQERYVDHIQDNNPSTELYFPQFQKLTRPHRCRIPIVREQPVYPGYIFAKVDLTTDSIHKLTSTPFRAYFIRFGNQISIVPDFVIIDLRRKESQNELVKEHVVMDPFTPGKRVRIHLPVASIEGIIATVVGRSRLVVQTDFGQWTVRRAQATLAPQ